MKQPITIAVEIHSSQFPERVRRDLIESLRTGRINHKFHYDSIKQAQKWLALHEAFSPARNDSDCRKIYANSFHAAAKIIAARTRNIFAPLREKVVGPIHVIGLGCGGGQKDVEILKILRRHQLEVHYTPCDVSVPLTLTASRAAARRISAAHIHPVVCDLATATDLPQVFQTHAPAGSSRLLTFFGMIPNFVPNQILPRLRSLIRRDDLLLLSANLAPGPDYAAGMIKIFPQYKNRLTSDWLLTFLQDLGIECDDGAIRFVIENGGQGLKRVGAHFKLSKKCVLKIGGETLTFQRGRELRLFFSYRYTPDRLRAVLKGFGLEVISRWITRSEEEGVFLCRRRRAP
jgi:uncharacterized SAM-dependent methyltransferase